MTMEEYQEIGVGASEASIKEKMGPPTMIHKKSDGTLEYEYVERIKVGERDLEERHYFFVIKDGQVISKRVKQMSPPAYDFDSYEMQTTHQF